MKYGIVISVSSTRFGPVVFKENLEENIIKAGEMGYDGVELAVRKTEEVDVAKIKRLIKKYNLQIIALGTGQIYGEEGLSFSSPNSDIRNKSIERTKRIIDIAKHLGASIIIGLIRGNINNVKNFEEELCNAEERISQCLEELLSYTKRDAINFLLEPINRYETNIFNRLDEVNNFLLRLKERIGLDRIGILADTFHMNIEEPNICKSLENAFPVIKHVHFADSNRQPPGYGHIDFKKIMKVLKKNRYKGFISFEMLPFPDSDTAAKKALEYIKNLDS